VRLPYEWELTSGWLYRHQCAGKEEGASKGNVIKKKKKMIPARKKRKAQYDVITHPEVRNTRDVGEGVESGVERSKKSSRKKKTRGE